MTAALKTRDIEGVEVLSVGTWNGHKFTPAMLDAMAAAGAATAGELDPPVKLGHDDSQKLLQEDGYPAAGWIANLRRVGQKLMADLKAVPSKVADLIDAGAYRKRSAEIRQDMEIGGKTYPWVFTGLALLGADLPAVESLDDIKALYSKMHLSLDDEAEPVYLEMPIDMMDNIESIMGEMQALHDRMEAMVKGKTGSPTMRQIFRAYREGMRRILKMSRADLAEWTPGYITNLPDSAFAYIAPGGEKDDQGKTVPRSLRFLPHHDDSGVVDMAHLRNALARISQADIPDAEKRRALAHLRAHATQAGVGEQQAREFAEEIKEAEMALDEKGIRELLGLDDDADILEAVTALKDKAEESKAKSEEADLEKDLADAEKRIIVLERENATQKAGQQVDAAISGGRLLPRQRAMAIKLALRDAGDFEEFMKTQPEGLVQLGEKGSSGDTAPDLAGLEPSETEVKVGMQLGGTRDEVRIRLMRAKAVEKGIELPANFGKDDDKSKS